MSETYERGNTARISMSLTDADGTACDPDAADEGGYKLYITIYDICGGSVILDEEQVTDRTGTGAFYYCWQTTTVMNLGQYKVTVSYIKGGYTITNTDFIKLVSVA